MGGLTLQRLPWMCLVDVLPWAQNQRVLSEVVGFHTENTFYFLSSALKRAKRSSSALPATF